MKFTQQIRGINRLETMIEFLETGFQFRFHEEAPFKVNDRKEVFFNYSVITDDQQIVRYQRKFLSVLYTIVAIVVMIGYFSFVATEMSAKMNHTAFMEFILKNSTLIFWTYIVGALVFYRTVIIKKMVQISMSNGGFISLLVDKNTDTIIAEMKKRRKAYLREAYLKDAETKSYLRAETVDWLFSLGVIERGEHAELHDLVKKNLNKKNADVGFKGEDEVGE